MEEALADERNLGDGSWQPRPQLRQHQGSEKPTSGDEAASGPDDAPAKESLMPSSLSNGDVQFNSQTPAHANESTTARREFQSGSDPVEGSSDDGDEGFEVKFDGDHDPISPRSLPKTRKWLITMIVCLSATCVTCTSSLYAMTYAQLTHDFHVSRVVATLGLSLFVFGLGCGSMFLGPLSEFFGRRPIYIISFLFFVIWIIPCAVAKNIATMLVARFINGVAGAAFLSVAGGTVADMFTAQELQAPMMIFTASPFVGPELGPLVGGFINQYTSWRWSFYVLIVWASTVLVGLVLFVPETYHPVVLKKKAVNLRNSTGNQRWYAPIERIDRSILQTVIRSCYRPFLLLTLEPMVLNLCLLSAIILGILYLFFGSFFLVFESNYNFTLSQVGMTFLGLLVGMILAIFTQPWWHKNYIRLVREREQRGGEPGRSEPEFRLPSAILGVWLVPIGLFWFAWTGCSSVHWIVPIIGSGVFGAGTLLVFSGVLTFLVDSYPLYAASALAANTFARNSFAAASPLFGIQMYEKLGYQWATTLLGFLALAMAPFPYIFFRYGKKIRQKSKFGLLK